MAGYIGKSQGVTQVDGYNRTEADDRYVNAAGDTMTGDLTIAGKVDAKDAPWGGFSGQVQFGNTGFIANYDDGGSNVQTIVGANAYYDGTNYRSIKSGADVAYMNTVMGEFTFNNAASTSSAGDLLTVVERMRIDSVGRVTMPYQPFFHAYMVANNNISSSNQLLAFDGVVSNIGGHYNNSTYRFTAPVSGQYFFSVGMRWNSVSSGYSRFTLRRNGVDNAYHMKILDPINSFGSNTGYQNSSQTVILQVSAGDYFEVIDYSENTGGQYCKDESHFIGYLIG